MGGGLVRIPIIEQRVGVGTGRPTLAPETVAPEARMLEGAGQFSEKLGGIIGIQQQHQQVLDQESARQMFAAQSKETEVKVKTELPATQWHTAYQQQMSQWADKFANDPNNAHISKFVTNQLPAMIRVQSADILEQGVAQTAHDQQAIWETQRGTLSNERAPAYLPESFTDSPQGQVIRSHVQNLLQARWPNSPDVQKAELAKFDQDTLQKRGESIAAFHPELMHDFVKANADKFTGDQVIGFLGKSNESRRMAQATIDAEFDQTRAAALNYQKDYVAANGRPDFGRLSSDAQFERITKQDFQRLAGYEYELPTPRTTLTGLDSNIANAPTIDDLKSIKADIEGMARNKLMNGGDVPTYNDMINKRIEFIRTTAGTADQNVRNAMRDFYSQARSGPQMQADRQWEMQNRGVFTQTMESAMGRYEALTYAKPNDPTEYWKAMDEVIKQHPRPSNPDAVAPDLGSLSTVTDYDALRALAIARSMKMAPSAVATPGGVARAK